MLPVGIPTPQEALMTKHTRHAPRGTRAERSRPGYWEQAPPARKLSLFFPFGLLRALPYLLFSCLLLAYTYYTHFAYLRALYFICSAFTSPNLRALFQLLLSLMPLLSDGPAPNETQPERSRPPSHPRTLQS